MALTEVYVDPSIAANSGDGLSDATAFGDLQYACDQTTLGTDGTRFNIKAGTAEILTAAISLATHGTPTPTQPVVFEGYTTTAGDGGQGSIEGETNTVSVFATAATDYLVFKNLDMVSDNGSHTINADNNCALIGCRVENSGAGIALDIDQGFIWDCDVICNTGRVCNLNNTSPAYFSRFSNSGTVFTVGVGGTFVFCIFDFDADTENGEAIVTGTTNGQFLNCTFKNANPGTSINAILLNGENNSLIANCYFEGFAGTGSAAISITGTCDNIRLINNYFFNNTTNVSNSSATTFESGSTSLGASGIDANFIAASTLKELALPDPFPGLASTPNGLSVGAVTPECAAGGGGIVGGPLFGALIR